MRRMSCNLMVGAASSLFRASPVCLDKKPIDEASEKDSRWMEEQFNKKNRTPEEIYAHDKARKELDDLVAGKTRAEKIEHHAALVVEAEKAAAAAAAAARAAAVASKKPADAKKNPIDDQEDSRWMEEQFNGKRKTPEERYAEEKQRVALRALADALLEKK